MKKLILLLIVLITLIIGGCFSKDRENENDKIVVSETNDIIESILEIVNNSQVKTS